MLRFHTGFFIAAVGLLAFEIWIAMFVHDNIVRPYAGDFLATIFLYWLGKAFVAHANLQVISAVLLLSYLIKTLQYFNLLTYLGLQHSRLARVLLGSHFDWSDLLAYTLGALIAVGAERLLHVSQSTLGRLPTRP